MCFQSKFVPRQRQENMMTHKCSYVPKGRPSRESCGNNDLGKRIRRTGGCIWVFLQQEQSLLLLSPPLLLLFVDEKHILGPTQVHTGLCPWRVSCKSTSRYFDRTCWDADFSTGTGTSAATDDVLQEHKYACWETARSRWLANYRPISVLPFMYKILENVVLRQEFQSRLGVLHRTEKINGLSIKI